MRFLLQSLNVRSIILIGVEAIFIVGALALASYLRFGEAVWIATWRNNGLVETMLIGSVTQGCLYYADLYDLRLLSDRRALLIRIIQALGSASIVLGVVSLWFPLFLLGGGVFTIAAPLVITFVTGWRLTFEFLSHQVRPGQRLLLVGTGRAAVALARELFERRHELGVEIVGFVDPDPARVGAPVINPGVIGTIEDIPSIVRARDVDRVVVSLADARGKLPMEKLLEMKLDGVSFDHLANVYETYTGKIALENLRPSWLIFSEGFKKSRLLSTVKRLMDVVLTAIGFVLALPLLLIVAAAVRLTSKGPVLYHQQRVGQNGRIFTVHKFRSMKTDAEAATGPVWASKAGDTRVTPIGKWLRKLRLDELPQLWNVLKGDMSLVGPRPERPGFVDELSKEIRFYRQRHIVRPGLTGWAQIRYSYGASTEDAIQKLQYDLYYIKNLTIALDLYIMFETIKTVVLRKGA